MINVCTCITTTPIRTWNISITKNIPLCLRQEIPTSHRHLFWFFPPCISFPVLELFINGIMQNTVFVCGFFHSKYFWDSIMLYVPVAHSYLFIYLFILVRVILHHRKIPEFDKSIFLHHLGRIGSILLSTFLLEY